VASPSAAPPAPRAAYAWRLVTAERAWLLSAADERTAGLWLAVLAAFAPARDAELARALPAIAPTAQHKPFATVSGLPEAAGVAVTWGTRAVP
jgi:hypothetical protein